MSKTTIQAERLAPCGRATGTCGQATQTCGRAGCRVEVRPARFDPAALDRVMTALFSDAATLEKAPEIGSSEAFAASDNPDCRQGGKACEGCLMVGWCLGDCPPALPVPPDGRRVVDYDFNGAPILEGRELLLPRYDGSNRPGIKRRAQMDATPEGRTLLAAAKEHLLQCMQLTPPTAAAMAARPCRCGPDGCSVGDCAGKA